MLGFTGGYFLLNFISKGQPFHLFSAGIIPLCNLIAVLSVSLALFNVLPIPVLDGGHLLFLGIEKVRGKALSIKVERAITNVGLSVLLCVMLMATYNDFLNFDIVHKVTRVFTGK